MEKNRGRHESRALRTCEVTAEQVVFPGATQAGLLERQTSGRARETVYLLTSRENLDAASWLKLQRQYWGIENGLHQRLDISAQEDRSRVRNRNACWILGMFRRLAVSFFCEWRQRNPTRKRTTLTQFYHLMALDCQRRGFLLVSAVNPSLGPAP